MQQLHVHACVHESSVGFSSTTTPNAQHYTLPMHNISSTHVHMLGLLSESDNSRVQKVLADKVVKVDASLELCVVDLAGSTGSVEGVLFTVPHLRLLLERVKEETHLEGGEKTVK